MIKRLFGILGIVAGLAVLGGAGIAVHGGGLGVAAWIGVAFGSWLGLGLVRVGLAWLLNIIDLDVYGVDPLNPYLAASTQRARSELHRFLQYLGEGKYHCFVKAPLRGAGGDIEHIWAVVHSHDGSGFRVSLANDPIEAPEAMDDRFRVSEGDVEDWQVVISEDEIRGGFSVGAIAQIVREDGYRLSRASRRMLERFVDLSVPGPEGLGRARA